MAEVKTCPPCEFCDGNETRDDGYPCIDCEGTGCARHPFCDIDHDADQPENYPCIDHGIVRCGDDHR